MQHTSGHVKQLTHIVKKNYKTSRFLLVNNSRIVDVDAGTQVNTMFTSVKRFPQSERGLIYFC